MRIIRPVSGSTAVDWQALDLASMTGTTDPGGWLTGSITESGGYLQIPISTSSNTTSIAGCPRLRWPMPSVDTGLPYVMLVRILFQTKPSGAYGAAVGLYDGTTGIAAGLRHRTSTGDMAAFVSRGASSTTGDDLSATSLASYGAISYAGDMDGVATLEHSAWTCLEEAGSTVTAAISTSPAAASSFGAQEVILSIPHASVVSEAETLSVRAEYAFVALALLT